jgi:hypothetical protein
MEKTLHHQEQVIILRLVHKVNSVLHLQSHVLEQAHHPRPKHHSINQLLLQHQQTQHKNQMTLTFLQVIRHHHRHHQLMFHKTFTTQRMRQETKQLTVTRLIMNRMTLVMKMKTLLPLLRVLEEVRRLWMHSATINHQKI